MSEPDTDIPTILDYMNEDCWRAILDYVSISDIIKSERVCSRWQTVVLTYLRGLRIGIEHPYPCLGSNELHRSVSWLLVRDHKPHSSLELWTNKLGPSVASTFCDTEECFRIIGENCPNLEAVKFMNLSDQLLRSCRNENFRWLQRICFIKCPLVTDRCVSQYAAIDALEELEIHYSQRVSGQCLKHIKPSLKSLVLNRCKSLEFRHLYTALDRFSNLSKLVLNLRTDRYGLYKNISQALSGLHKLEYLELYCQNTVTFFNRTPYMGLESLIEAVCRLKNLKHLGGEVVNTDQQLERVFKCCRELRSLDLEYCTGVTSPGLARLCHDARLTSLGLHKCELSEDDIVACVYNCPDLTKLDVRRNRDLSRALIPRVAAARSRLRAPRPLHFCIDNILLDLRLNGDLEKYDQLILHF